MMNIMYNDKYINQIQQIMGSGFPTPKKKVESCLDIGKIWPQCPPVNVDLHSASFPKMSTNRSDTPLITCTRHEVLTPPAKEPNQEVQQCL